MATIYHYNLCENKHLIKTCSPKKIKKKGLLYFHCAKAMKIKNLSGKYVLEHSKHYYILFEHC